MKRFLAALQFLTLIPVPLHTPISLGRAAIFFPAIGCLLGAAAGALTLLLQPGLGAPLASLLTLCFLLLVTGGLHEDGLADVADACRAGRPRDTILRIMKDSRIGTYGALALIATLLLRWQALSRCRINPILGLMAALSLSRTGIVVLAALSRSVGDGLGAAFSRDLSKRGISVTILLGLAVAIVCVRSSALPMVGVSTIVVFGARAYFDRRIGGVNGDCLGATCQIIETVNLLILAWEPFT